MDKHEGVNETKDKDKKYLIARTHCTENFLYSEFQVWKASVVSEISFTSVTKVGLSEVCDMVNASILWYYF